MAVARLNSNGTFDTTFNGNGKVITDFGNNTYDAGQDVTVQPDGKIIAVGQTAINDIDIAIARYNSNGSLDASFGNNGKINIDFDNRGDYGSSVALQPDGKIIVGGIFSLFPFTSGLTAIRLDTNGTFDISFGGGNGKATTILGEGVATGLDQSVNDILLQPDGKIVLAGKTNFNSTDRDFTVVRYVGDPQPCSYSINPILANVNYDGGNGTVTINTQEDCGWTAVSNANWITTSSSGSGSDIINFSVAENTGAARTGTITAGGQIFTIIQSGFGSGSEFKISASDGLSQSLFGSHVAISGDTAVVVSPGNRGGGFSSTTPQRLGEAYVFVRTPENTWQQEAVLTGNGDPYSFGASVTISGDTIVVGAFEDINSNIYQGSAYIFTRTGTIWTQQAKLVASDGATFDRFGDAVSISDNTVVIGAQGYGPTYGTPSYPHTPGSAYVFVRNGSTWTQQQKILASDGAVDDFFGASVAISDDQLIVGAWSDDIGTITDQGSAYIFTRSRNKLDATTEINSKRCKCK